ncbi:Inner membrane protein YedI [Escherichia coli]|nr:Inner membrane protein YedI [Escherichia coli]
MLEARKHKEDPAQSQQRLEKLAAQDPLKFEKDKIKGAIRTGFYIVCGNRRHHAGDCGRSAVA